MKHHTSALYFITIVFKTFGINKNLFHFPPRDCVKSCFKSNSTPLHWLFWKVSLGLLTRLFPSQTFQLLATPLPELIIIKTPNFASSRCRGCTQAHVVSAETRSWVLPLLAIIAMTTQHKPQLKPVFVCLPLAFELPGKAFHPSACTQKSGSGLQGPVDTDGSNSRLYTEFWWFFPKPHHPGWKGIWDPL